jgi:hypothetical protein
MSGFANVFEGLLDPLLAAAQPELFRLNAFRILGLPVEATERAIKREADEAQMRIEYGDGEEVRKAGPLPLNPPPDIDVINEAVHRLRDPEQRLIHEFFWFWPWRPGEGNNDPALAALAQEDLKLATKVWYERIQNDDAQGIALHNIAVFYQVYALDMEFMPELKPLSEERRKLQAAYWKEALVRWRMLVKDDRFWRRLEERIREIDDPRLAPETARQIRRSLPAALPLINAQLAVRAILQGEAKETERQQRLMRETGFEEQVIEESLRRALRPLIEQIRTLCEAAEPEAESNPGGADEVMRRLLQQAEALLDALAGLLPADDPLPVQMRDEVGASALNCLVPFGQQRDNWQSALELLDLIRPYAHSSSVRDRMDDTRVFLLSEAFRPGDLEKAE